MSEKRSGQGYRFFVRYISHAGDDCVIWPYSCCTAGYGAFMVEKKVRLAHREMCRVTHGDPPTDGHHAAHSCGNRRCINPRHLSWKTQSENQIDRRSQGTSKQKYAKLTLAKVAQIRQLKGVETSIATAARYGVTESNIRQIQDGKIWRADRKNSYPITDDQVRAIRKLGYSATLREISDQLGVNLNTVDLIRRGISYRSVS